MTSPALIVRKLVAAFLLGGCAAPGAATESPTPAATQAFEALSAAVRSADKMSFLTFEKPCFECRVAALKPEDVLRRGKVVPLDAESTRRIKALLSDKEAFALHLSKACPSVAPTSGVVLHAGNRTSVFLLYPNCKTGRLVQEHELPPYYLNLDPMFGELTTLAGK